MNFDEMSSIVAACKAGECARARSANPEMFTKVMHEAAEIVNTGEHTRDDKKPGLQFP